MHNYINAPYRSRFSSIYDTNLLGNVKNHQSRLHQEWFLHAHKQKPDSTTVGACPKRPTNPISTPHNTFKNASFVPTEAIFYLFRAGTSDTLFICLKIGLSISAQSDANKEKSSATRFDRNPVPHP